MELKQIEYFLQLAKLQHMSRTADFLNISQPTLSKSLAALEKSVGVPLFDRVGNRLQLNDSGRKFYEKTQQAMQILNSASMAARQHAYEVTGDISIICIAFAPILVPCVCDYMELNPRVNIQLLHFNHLLNSSGEADYDFILTASRYTSDLSNSKLWVTESLFEDSCYFIISKAHPQFSQLPRNPEDFDLRQFSEANFITMRQDRNYADFSYSICRNAGFLLKSYFQTDDFQVKMRIVRSGQGVAFIPSSCLESALILCPDLRAFPIHSDAGQRTVQIMRKRKNLLSEASLDFWEFLLDYFQLSPDNGDD